MNDRQRLFVAEYLKDHNGAAAYRRSGYSAPNNQTAASGAERLLRNVEVKAAIDAAVSAQLKRVEVDADFVISRLKENVERAMNAVPVRDRDGKETGEWQYQGSVANRALELLGKSIGLFKDVQEHTGKGGQPLQFTEVRLAYGQPTAIPESDSASVIGMAGTAVASPIEPVKPG